MASSISDNYVYSQVSLKRGSSDVMTESSPWRRAEYSYERILKPFHASLRLFGLAYDPQLMSGSVNLGRCYHWFVVVVLWLNFLRYFGAYSFGESFSLELTTKLVAHAVLFWGASGSAAGGMITKQRPYIFRNWRRYIRHYGVIHDEECRARGRKRVIIATCVCWSAFLVHCSTTAYISFEPNLRYFVRIMLLPFVDPCGAGGATYPALVAVVLGLNLFNVTICVFQLGYLWLMTLGVSDEFSCYNQAFQDHLDTDTKSLAGDGDSLEYWRQRHLSLCRLVSSVDMGFGLYVLLVFVTNIPICSFLVFRIVFTMSHFSQTDGFIPMLVLLVWNLSLSVGILLVITYIGTRLNTEATACKSNLYSLELKGKQWNIERILQYMTFYNKLTEGHIGITGWKLFYINKFTTKTVILMIVSYSFVLLKFGLIDADQPFRCHVRLGDEFVATTTGLYQHQTNLVHMTSGISFSKPP